MTYEVLGEQTTSKKGAESGKYKRLKESSSPFLYSCMNRCIQATIVLRRQTSITYPTSKVILKSPYVCKS